MEFQVLGPVEVFDEGLRLNIGGRKQRTVLALLIANCGRPTSADKLIEGTYGEGAPAGARHSVQTYISNLRGRLGDVISSAGHSYELRSDGSTVDFVEFERLVQAARARLDEDCITAAAELRTALAMWRGSPFEDVDARGDLGLEITRLNELRMVALETRIEADLGCGRHQELVGELEALTAEHPFREGFHAQLMLALYRSGRQAAALRAYQRMREHLADELGIAASPALRELEQRILEQDPSLRLAPSSGTPEPDLATSPPTDSRSTAPRSVLGPQPLEQLDTDHDDTWVAPVVQLPARQSPEAERDDAPTLSPVLAPGEATAEPVLPRPRRARWRLAILLGSIALGVAVGVVLVVSMNGSRDTSVTTVAGAAGPKWEDEIEVGEKPQIMWADESAVWATLVGEGAIVRIDAITHEQTKIAVGENPTRPLDSSNRLWVPSRTGGPLAVVDKESLSVVEYIPAGERLDTPVDAAGLVWVTARESSEIVVIDPATLREVDRIELPGFPMTPVVANGGLWVLGRHSGDVTRIDAVTRQPQLIHTVASGAHPPIFAGGAIWIVNRNHGTVTIIDTLDHSRLPEITIGGELSAPVLVGDELWVSDATTQSVIVVNTDDPEINLRRHTGLETTVPTAHKGVVWATDPERGVAIRIDPETWDQQEFRVGGTPGVPLSAHGFVWVPDASGTTITLYSD